MDRRNFLTKGGAALAAAAATNPLQALAASSESRSIPGYAINKGSANPKPLATASNDLSPYTGPWEDRQILHLLRRAMMGVPYTQFVAAKGMAGMSAIVDKLIEDRPLPPKPGPWVDALYQPDRTITDPALKQIDFQNKQRFNRILISSVSDWWLDLILKEDLSIREKMTLMWSNHFVTGWDVVNQMAFVYTYLVMLRRNALGNVKTFANEMAIDPAMLIYLNGAQSTYRLNKNNINENFARELMELFTLGIFDPKTGENNYTETDIQEAAKALSGWMPTQTAPFVGQFNPTFHYPDDVTFFGDTGKFGVKEIIDRIFAKKGGYNAAYFICQRIYETFVYYVPNPEVVDKMAELLVASNWEIKPVMKALLESAHFYDAEVLGAQLKSPLELVGSVIREFNLKIPAYDGAEPPVARKDANQYNVYQDLNPTHSYLIQYAGMSLSQEILNPPNVAGWPGGRIWINTGTLPPRKTTPAAAVTFPNFFNGSGGRKSAKISFVPMDWINLIPGAVDMTSSEITNAMTDFILAFDLGPKEHELLRIIIYANATSEDSFYFDEEAVAKFAQGIVMLPEFQLV
jgi:uncharacterized protein (DUF1800 family)